MANNITNNTCVFFKVHIQVCLFTVEERRLLPIAWVASEKGHSHLGVCFLSPMCCHQAEFGCTWLTARILKYLLTHLGKPLNQLNYPHFSSELSYIFIYMRLFKERPLILGKHILNRQPCILNGVPARLEALRVQDTELMAGATEGTLVVLW